MRDRLIELIVKAKKLRDIALLTSDIDDVIDMPFVEEYIADHLIANGVIVSPGIDDLGSVLICAVRYCIGRQTYMPKVVMDFTVPLLPILNDTTILCMMRDIRDATNYGDPDIDQPDWMNFSEKINQEIGRRYKTVRETDKAKTINFRKWEYKGDSEDDIDLLTNPTDRM